MQKNNARRSGTSASPREGGERGQARYGIALITASLVLAVFVAAIHTSPWRGHSAPAEAFEVPAAGAAFVIQTNGPNAVVGLGDWYTATSAGAGAGYHYAIVNIPCGWPSGTPVDVDLWSPEMNRVSGALAQSEEPLGNYDSTQFELYAAGTSIGPGYASPAPGAGTLQTTYQPGAIGVGEAWVRFATISPATCGSYVLRSAVLDTDPLNPTGEGNDQNGWRLRVGRDDDADPTNAPPANSDDFDGVPGTNDELSSGLGQITFQHNAGGTQCQTFFEFVDAGLASITLNDFDFDNNGRVRYYAPSDTVDPNGLVGGTAGTISAASATWNGSGTIARGGDTINNPESGWWSIVTCISNGNQYIEEGQDGVAFYFTQPSTPQLAVSKTDGLTSTNPGDPLTYTITIDNTASGATAGAASNVIAIDTLPANASFVSCTITAPAAGTCTESTGVVTMTLTGVLNAGDSVEFTIDVTVNGGASGTVQNDVSVVYEDDIGSVFEPVTAADADTIPTPTSTPTASATATPTDTPTTTSTPTVTDTPSATNTPTSTDTPAATNTAAPTNTPAATNTPLATNTSTATATALATDTPGATNTPVATSTPTASSTTLASSETATPASTSTPDAQATFRASDPAGLPGGGGDSIGAPSASAPERDSDATRLPDSGTGPGDGAAGSKYAVALALMLAVAGAIMQLSAARRIRSGRE